MVRRLLRGFTFANVCSFLALTIALGTGTAYAANTVFSADIVDGEVKTRDIGADQVTTGRIAPGNVFGADLANGSVNSSKVFLDSLTSGDLAADSVTGSELAADAVTGSELAADSVNSAKVLLDSLTSDDLAANSVGASEIATDAVQATEIANDSIDSGEIVDFGLSNQDVGVLFAQVNANGTLANSSGGGVTTLKIGVGTYEVDFGRNISGCAFVATIGPAGTGSAAGEVNAADRFNNVEAVFVDTNTSTGAAADRPFQLVVVC